jgi:hypothetical protein
MLPLHRFTGTQLGHDGVCSLLPLPRPSSDSLSLTLSLPLSLCACASFDRVSENDDRRLLMHTPNENLMNSTSHFWPLQRNASFSVCLITLPHWHLFWCHTTPFRLSLLEFSMYRVSYKLLLLLHINIFLLFFLSVVLQAHSGPRPFIESVITFHRWQDTLDEWSAHRKTST